MKKLIIAILIIVFVWSLIFNLKLYYENKELLTTEQEMVTQYIQENIKYISPINSAVGSDWEITSIDFLADKKVTVDYRDGFKERRIILTYNINLNPEVKISNIEDISSN